MELHCSIQQEGQNPDLYRRRSRTLLYTEVGAKSWLIQEKEQNPALYRRGAEPCSIQEKE